MVGLLDEHDIRYEVKTYNTSGDIDKTTPISEMEGTDFFTKEIDKMLLNGKIDLAVHSAKDLPDVIDKELVICAMTKSVDPHDVLVSKRDLKLDKLPYGAKIGTSSLRRKEQLKKFRGDLRIVDIRGNIEERLRLLDETDLDAIVIAAAGLLRLELEYRITERIPFEILTPHPLQGRLAVVTRKSDETIIRLYRKCLS